MIKSSKVGHFMAADLLYIRCTRRTSLVPANISRVYRLSWPASQAAFAIGKNYSHMLLKYEKKTA